MPRPDPKSNLSYLDALHAMQTGVMHKMERDPSETSPKQLRVGINSAMSEFAGLTELLVAKGIITDEELMESIRRSANIEVDEYEAYLSERLGAKVTLR